MDVKSQNESRLRALGMKVNEYLPIIEPIGNKEFRSSLEVVRRAGVLSHIVGIGYGRSGLETRAILRDQGLDQNLSPLESSFLSLTSYSEHDKAFAAWHFAAVHSLAWALKLEDMVPLKDCADTLASHFLPKASEVAKNSTLRPHVELYHETDFYYRLHWAARDAHLHNEPFPRPIIEVELRRKSLEWIIGKPTDWDDVSLDT